MGSRELTWEGCLNVRDLGGLPTADGAETSFRRLVRADSVAQLSDGGVAALLEYGVRTIVDLRMSSELEPDWPRTGDVTALHSPFCRHTGPDQWAELDRIGLAAGDDVEATRAVYVEMLERNREYVATAITTVATAARSGTVLVHCQGGKDRTGLLSALLLELAHVERDAIAADYAYSRLALAEHLDAWIDEASDDRERELRLLVSATPAPSMLGVLTDLEAVAFLRALMRP
jgi:protein-tyrosine phosphatase